MSNVKVRFAYAVRFLFATHILLYHLYVTDDEAADVVFSSPNRHCIQGHTNKQTRGDLLPFVAMQGGITKHQYIINNVPHESITCLAVLGPIA